MKRVVSAITVGLTSAGLLASAGGGTQAGMEMSYFFTDAQRQNIEAAHNQLNEHWSRQLGSEATSQLAIIEGDATFTCNGVDFTRSGDMLSPYYCAKKDTVVIAAGWMRSLMPILVPPEDHPQVTSIIMAHEHGHDVQYAVRQLPPVSWDDKPAWEQQADCLAGEASQAVFPDAVQAGHDFFAGLPDEFGITHGPSDRRTEAYDYGVANQGCLTAFLEYDY